MEMQSLAPLKIVMSCTVISEHSQPAFVTLQAPDGRKKKKNRLLLKSSCGSCQPEASWTHDRLHSAFHI